MARWTHWISGVDDAGRVRLPAELRPGPNESSEFRAVSCGQVMVLRRNGDGAIRCPDSRGRLVLPAWLRRLVGPDGTVMISAGVPEADVAVVTAARVLDELVTRLVGEVG